MLVVVGFSVAGAFIGAPVIAWLHDGALTLDLPVDVTVEDPLVAFVLVPFGLVAWFLTMHAVTLFSCLHALWARTMLGSRARHQPRPEPDGAPAPMPGTGLAALGPAAPAVEDEPRVVSVPRLSAPPMVQEAGGFHPAVLELTPREREVLLLVARGYSNADICEACYISEGTVKTHVRHILAKLELTDRTQLIVFAYENGIVTPSQRPVATSLAR